MSSSKLPSLAHPLQPPAIPVAPSPPLSSQAHQQQQQGTLAMQLLLHGDLINALTNGAFLPLYIYKAVTEVVLEPAPTRPEGPCIVCLTFTVTIVGCFHAWWFSNVTSSWLGFIATIGSIVGVCYYQWPHGDETLLPVQLVWQLLVCSANVSHTLTTKVVMGLLAACTTLVMSHVSPHYATGETHLLVLIATVVHIAFNAAVPRLFPQLVRPTASAVVEAVHSSMQPSVSTPPKSLWLDFKERKVEYAAMFVLISVFLYFVGNEVVAIMTTPGYAVTGGVNIVRAGLVGAIGLVAGGAFRQNDGAETEHDSVHGRRRRASLQSAQQQAENLRIARLALNASDAAMAFTDPERRIQWCNPSFLRLTGSTIATTVANSGTLNPTATEGDLQNMPLQEALGLSSENAKKLHRCFRQDRAPADMELILRGTIVHARVSPSANLQIANGYVIVLKDVTEERSLERFLASTMQASHGSTSSQTSAMRQARVNQSWPTTMSATTHQSQSHDASHVDEVAAITSIMAEHRKKDE